MKLVRCVCAACALHVRCVGAAWRCVCTAWAQRVHWLCSACAQRVHCDCAALHVHCVGTACELRVRCEGAASALVILICAPTFESTDLVRRAWDYLSKCSDGNQARIRKR